MKKTFVLLLLIMIIPDSMIIAETKIESVAFRKTTIQKFHPLFINISIRSTVPNPFNSEEIKLDAIVKSPSQKEIIQPGYFSQSENNLQEWMVKFCPVETGEYSFTIYIQTPVDTITSKTFSFKTVASSKDGFIRLNPESNYTFRFDSGKQFRGIGENVCWAENYEHYFKKLNENGCNFTRIWMCPWNLYLEWNDPGLGKYNLENAAKLDSVLSLAEKYGIYIMLCFDYHGVAQKSQGHFKENKWLENPYNQINGGPCKHAADIFTNPEARKYYKNRLRYIVARYSYNPHILAWEFWNEVDLTAGSTDDVIAWHAEMAAYLKQIDPYQHLRTTSFSGDGYPDIWKIEELDFSQTHHYNNPDFAVSLSKIIPDYEAKYHKPHVIGEFGSDYRGVNETKENDPDNIGFHNGLWAGLFSPTPIVPLTWWWDVLIDTENLYFHFKALTDFMSDASSFQGNIHEMKLEPVFIQSAQLGKNGSNDDIVIFPAKGWGKSSGSEFEILPNGLIDKIDQVPGFLQGKAKIEMRQTPTFKITYLKKGTFSVHVNQVSDQGLLKIFLDNELKLEKALPMGSGKGEWEESHWNSQWKIYQGRYNKTFTIDVPKGDHEIRVENDGEDWFEITKYSFENCCIRVVQMINVAGLQIDDCIYLWLRNSEYSWKKVAESGLPVPIKNANLKLGIKEAGDYQVEWWDTYKGTVIREEIISIEKNDFSISVGIPDLSRDIALKMKRIDRMN